MPGAAEAAHQLHALFCQRPADTANTASNGAAGVLGPLLMMVSSRYMAPLLPLPAQPVSHVPCSDDNDSVPAGLGFSTYSCMCSMS